MPPESAVDQRLRADERTGARADRAAERGPGLPDWATSLGISALVAKPFDPAGLPGAIRDALHR